MDNKDNSLHLGRKYARIFVLGHYLFLVQVATMVYKSIHGLAPDYLGSLFTKYDPPYNLGNSGNKQAVPLPRTNFLKNSFSYDGVVIWNSLYSELRQAKSKWLSRFLRLNRQNAHGIYVKQNFLYFHY